jgi:hypothetical protein
MAPRVNKYIEARARFVLPPRLGDPSRRGRRAGMCFPIFTYGELMNRSASDNATRVQADGNVNEEESVSLSNVASGAQTRRSIFIVRVVGSFSCGSNS